MKYQALELRSALIGLGLAGLLVFLTSAGVTTAPVKTLRLNLDPEASSIVRVDEGELFKVPDKLRFVLKAASGGFDTVVRINGEVVFNTGIDTTSPLETFGFPLVAQAGDVVSVEEGFVDPNRLAFVTGYLSE